MFLEESNPNTAYCKICEINLEGTGKAAHSYCQKGGNTTNLIAHLQDRYYITKKNYLYDQLQITNYINISAPCSYQWQEEITKKLVEFIIQYIQPLYILQVDAFQNLLLTCEPSYRIPCNKTVKGILYLVYEWILEGLKQYKPFHRRIKSLQAFFRSPKQGQRLHAMQQKNSQQGHQLSENEHMNLLDILTDIKTRWTSKKEGEKLECLCLNLEEREFFQQIIGLLEPIEHITRKICSATYLTITLINLYIDLLKNFFAPCEEAEETFDTYFDLIYGSELVNNNRNETNSSSDYELPLCGSRQQWQHAHRQFKQKIKNKYCNTQRYCKKEKNQSSDINLDNINTVEDLPSVNTTGILQKSVLSDISLITPFLDPRFKDFEWCNSKGKAKTKSIVRELYYDMNSSYQPT
ncbi:17630_t:CDS:2, partial [Gigaspora margarita]